MANPVIVACTKDTWTKVATDVQVGNVWIKNRPSGGFSQTYRLTGGAVPTGDDAVEGMPILDIGIPIDSSPAIDVYIYAKGSDGSVRVDV